MPILYLSEIDQTKEKLMSVLEDRRLSFLYPMLMVQQKMSRAIETDPNPTSIYKWIKDNVNSKMHTTPVFINVLTTSLLKYITSLTTLGDGVDPQQPPEKTTQEQEKELVDRLKPVLQLMIHDYPNLQLVALYALQVHCYQNQFPKGMLLRMFMYFYDMEIVEEEVFLRWKEDITDVYPGKGKGLFQVNQWLTWLEEAEEEEEDEGSDPE
ncbi:PREDICTED: eukaryotic translation initiation factor 4 gamma 2-like [Priapulus caudatus]|uniref:Eukaryotic translation initiation factor 4 gamma 2-like n=1 Tax=Priapulus caudatus TaxID=37621 RepID=A0ABM1ETK7_PRICU|nr:PREDICTED: eukaryotic translation initiation factor 4 gamma 2-like [Priapulus caudatus]